MKNSIKLLFAAFICGAVLFACQKGLEKVSPSEPQAKALTNVYAYEMIIGSGSVVEVSIGVESTTGYTEVTRTSVTGSGNEFTGVYSYSGSLVNTSTGQVDIPDDGNVYWWVPATTTGEPQIMTGGQSYDITCPCGGTSGSCGVAFPSKPGPGNCGECKNVDCNGAICEPAVIENSGTGHGLGSSGVVVMGQKIVVDGTGYTAKTISSNSGTSVYINPLTGGSNSTELSISRSVNGQTVTISTSPSSNSPDASFFIYDIGVADNFGGTVNIPNNGEKYWKIPLTGGGTPSVMNGGGTLIFYCTCSDVDGGTCTPATTDDCNPYCEQGSCTSCDEAWKQGVIIRANAIVYNGVTYQ